MTASQIAMPAMPRAPKIHPDSLSPGDHAIQLGFTRLTIGRKRVSEHTAYAAYERSVCRENSYATLVGSGCINLASRADFFATARAERAERDALGVLAAYNHTQSSKG